MEKKKKQDAQTEAEAAWPCAGGRRQKETDVTTTRGSVRAKLERRDSGCLLYGREWTKVLVALHSLLANLHTISRTQLQKWEDCVRGR